MLLLLLLLTADLALLCINPLFQSSLLHMWVSPKLTELVLLLPVSDASCALSSSSWYLSPWNPGSSAKTPRAASSSLSCGTSGGGSW